MADGSVGAQDEVTLLGNKPDPMMILEFTFQANHQGAPKREKVKYFIVPEKIMRSCRYSSAISAIRPSMRCVTREPWKPGTAHCPKSRNLLNQISFNRRRDAKTQ